MLSDARIRAGAAPWSRAWLLWSFTRREVLNRYAGSMAGLAWAIAHPLALLAVYAFVFTAVFRVSLPAGAGKASYLTFVAVSLWPWLMFSDGALRGMAAIRANEGLIRKVAFPHRLLVFAAVGSSFAIHVIGYAAVLVALRLLGQPIALRGAPAALVLLVALMVGTVGVAAFLAAIQTLLRDVEHVIPVVMMLLFYATPVLYPVSLVPERFRPWLEANPLTQVFERLHEVLLNGSGLVASDGWIFLAAFALLAAGLWVFERLSPFFEDFL
jgi:homopolymeric O-antigen transport system permease protein